MKGRRATGAAPEPELWQLRFAAPQRLVEAAEPLFEAALSVARVRGGDGSENWVLEALFDDEPAAMPIRAGLALAAKALGMAAPALEISRLEPRDWLAENRAALTEIAAGRFRVVPEHRRGAVPPSPLLNLYVDAGPAFGSGRHETTRSCLHLLEEIARRRQPRRILDLGTGSGILALAAVRLWKRPVIATDIDPVAVRTARLNARRNGSLPWIDARCGGNLDPVRRVRPFDLAIANILAGPLIDMAPALRRVVARRGLLILSGILSSQENGVLGRYRAAGFRLERRLVQGPWASFRLKRR